jgi:cytochrome b561
MEMLQGLYMMRNTTAVWGSLAKALHWVGAALILVLLVHGAWMTHLAPRPDRLANYTWHAALGYDLFALSLVRLIWRWLNPVPALPADLERWERIAARAGHIGLYLLMLAVGVTGWALAGTFRVAMDKDIFGLGIPALISSQDRSVHDLFETTHLILAYGLAALVAAHLAGALRHHLVKHNDILRRMTWGARGG